MSLKSLNQKGFTAIETILIIVILAIIGGTGYYIFQANSKATDAQNAAQTNANTATPPKTSQASKADYVTINEWGVRAPYGGKLHLSYTIKKDADYDYVAYAYFTSSELSDQGGLCADSSDYGGVITRYPADEKYLNYDGSPSSQTASAYAATLDSSQYANAGDHYFFYTSPQADCADSKAGQDVQAQTMQDVKALLNKLEAVPSS